MGAGFTILALGTTLIWPPRPALIWNRTASSPIGLYAVTAHVTARTGDMVVAWPPDAARRLGAERRYLPYNVPLIKRVAGAAGDRVCGIGYAIFINGRLAATRTMDDPSGRPMPWWSGCQSVARGDLFLLTPGVPAAFDGRYFGVSSQRQIVGRARLLWKA